MATLQLVPECRHEAVEGVPHQQQPGGDRVLLQLGHLTAQQLRCYRPQLPVGLPEKAEGFKNKLKSLSEWFVGEKYYLLF